jgi:hypothetical protein
MTIEKIFRMKHEGIHRGKKRLATLAGSGWLKAAILTMPEDRDQLLLEPSANFALIAFLGDGQDEGHDADLSQIYFFGSFSACKPLNCEYPIFGSHP